MVRNVEHETGEVVVFDTDDKYTEPLDVLHQRNVEVLTDDYGKKYVVDNTSRRSGTDWCTHTS